MGTYLVLGKDEDVPSSQVAVYEALRLEVCHALGHLVGKLCQLGHGEGGAQGGLLEAL